MAPSNPPSLHPPPPVLLGVGEEPKEGACASIGTSLLGKGCGKKGKLFLDAHLANLKRVAEQSGRGGDPADWPPPLPLPRKRGRGDRPERRGYVRLIPLQKRSRGDILSVPIVNQQAHFIAGRAWWTPNFSNSRFSPIRWRPLAACLPAQTGQNGRKMSPKGDMRRNALRPEFIRRAFANRIVIY